jgi:hypothetical protein
MSMKYFKRGGASYESSGTSALCYEYIVCPKIFDTHFGCSKLSYK